jgi:hypothetical protein
MTQVNLIRLFDFYLAAMFLLSTMRRLSQYRSIAAIVFSAPGRWPRLLREMKQHGAIFFTWTTLRPAALALSLSVVHMIVSRVIWPSAYLTLIDLFQYWYVLPVVLLTLMPMLGVDTYFLVRVGRIDRDETVKYLDQAEHWLTSWKAPVVRFLTLGYIDPRRMVNEEVRNALTALSDLMNRNFYWMSLQIGLRVLFGLVLWGIWAIFVGHQTAA